MDMKSVSLHIFSTTPDGACPSARPSEFRLSRPTRGVLFDMCNIFYDDTVWRRWLLRLLGQIGLHTNYRSFFHLWDCDCLGDVYVGRKAFCEAFESFLRSVGMSAGQIEEVQAASRTHRRAMEDSLRAFPGVKSTIAKLADSGMVLGAVCNSELTGRELRGRIERFGMGSRFAAVVSSIDARAAMPLPDCYLAALREMRLPAEEVAFVGHDASQLGGAAAVGMSTVALNFDEGAHADIYLNRMEELVDTLATCELLAAVG